MILFSIAKLWPLIEGCCVEAGEQLRAVPALLSGKACSTKEPTVPIDQAKLTAVLLVGKRHRAGIQMLSWVQRNFPNRFKNFIFVAVGELAAPDCDGQEDVRRLRKTIESSLRYYTSYCHRRGLAAEYRVVFGANPMAEFTRFTQEIREEYPRVTCFAGEVMFWA
jgi:hypothetical protein